MQAFTIENSLIKKNILQYLDLKGVSKYEFYKKTGISNGILSQDNGMSEQNTMKFLSAYPEINPTWLLTGEGPMLRRGSGTPDTPPATQTPAEPAEPDQTGSNKPADSFSTASGHLDAEKLSLYILNHVKELEQQPIFMSYIKQKAYEIALDIVTEKLSK